MNAQQARDYLRRFARLSSFYPRLEEAEHRLGARLADVFDDDELVVIFAHDIQRTPIRDSTEPTR